MSAQAALAMEPSSFSEPKPNHALLKRHVARVAAIQLLFSYDFEPHEQSAHELQEYVLTHYESLAELESSATPDRKFLKKILEGTLEHLEVVDAMIKNHLASDWKLETLDPVIRAILRVGTYELCYTNVPPKVVIDEYVQVTQHYFSDVECKLVNALLDALFKSGVRN